VGRGGGCITVYVSRRVVAVRLGESEGINLKNPMREGLKSPVPQSCYPKHVYKHSGVDLSKDTTVQLLLTELPEIFFFIVALLLQFFLGFPVSLSKC
jgi:hypothetical protein